MDQKRSASAPSFCDKGVSKKIASCESNQPQTGSSVADFKFNHQVSPQQFPFRGRWEPFSSAVPQTSGQLVTKGKVVTNTIGQPNHLNKVEFNYEDPGPSKT